MAKVTKTQLKSLVKECLVEILSEGLSTETSALTESRELRSPKPKKRVKPKSSPALDKISFGQTVSNTVSALTDDPVLADIFGDTARTTLQEQLSAEQGAPGAGVSSLSNSDPGINTEVFGGASDRWADLAFASAKKEA
jgi:hypothetical protein